jgi:hypothetical protein
METRLRKSGIYGLLFGLAFSILFVDYKDVTPMSNGGSVTTYKPVLEYIVSILRFGIIGMFIGMLIGWKYFEGKNKTKKRKSYYSEFFIAVLLIATILLFVFNW